MTLFSHKLVDAADDGSLVTHPGTIQHLVTVMRNGVKAAEKFDFGLLPLEAYRETPKGFKIPKLTDDERQFWREGLIPLPAPICWFEFKLTEDGERSGLLITDDNSRWSVQRVDVIRDRFTYDGVMAFVDRTPDSEYTIFFKGNKEIIAALNKDHNLVARLYGSNFLLSIYLCLMLNSRTTERVLETPPPKLNRARVKRGCEPLATHHVVTIVPSRYYDHGDGRSDRRSPRLHWRRSHRRGLADGRSIVIPRCLVGRAELGTVTHEYKVKP